MYDLTSPEKPHREMYHIAGMTDLDKMKEDAFDYSQGDSRNKPEHVIIHMHAKSVPCEPSLNCIHFN